METLKTTLPGFGRNTVRLCVFLLCLVLTAVVIILDVIIASNNG